MAILLVTLDEPLGIPQEKWDAYSNLRETWVKAVLVQPGVKEMRFYANPNRGTPTALVIYEFENYAAAHQFVHSEASRKVIVEMRGWGVTSVSFQIWENSPVFTEPVRPHKG